MKEWFESWFDTPFYHILYRNRDHSEAELFIRNLFKELSIDKEKTVLDLACGKGRHAIFVNSMGYKTYGADLSISSIEQAKKKENKSLRFFQHDMRLPIKNQTFDLVLNLFTSFGYFDSTSENLKVLNSVHSYLNADGRFVIDFLNADYICENMVESEQKVIEGIEFNIAKSIKDEIIVKDISFEHEGESFHFQEKVQLIRLEKFNELLDAANFKIEKVFGDYRLGDLNDNSERLIIIAKKK